MEKFRIKYVLAAGVLLVLPLAACSTKPVEHADKGQKPASEPPQATARSGEELFKQYCANCHPDGGNVSDPEKNLRRATLKAAHITRPEDIIRVMRRPESRMITFDQSTISDRDARAIAEYVLKAF